MMTSLLKYRGVIEGFHGLMWSHKERFLYRLPASLVEYAKKVFKEWE
jgi:hypothetical protein